MVIMRLGVYFSRTDFQFTTGLYLGVQVCIKKFNHQIILFEFSPTGDAIHNFRSVKIIQILQNGGQLFSNFVVWCHV